jgi:hypothetical protein
MHPELSETGARRPRRSLWSKVGGWWLEVLVYLVIAFALFGLADLIAASGDAIRTQLPETLPDSTASFSPLRLASIPPLARRPRSAPPAPAIGLLPATGTEPLTSEPGPSPQVAPPILEPAQPSGSGPVLEPAQR